MKKSLFTLTLLAALMFCGCEGAFDPGNTPEEPLIRAGGIIDRIYMTSEDTSHNETACTVSIENNRLLLTLDKASTFTVTIWHQEAAEFFFSLKYVNTPSASINISLFPNGNYTLYINEQGIFCFAIKDGVAYTKNDNKADLVDWNEIWQQATNVPKGTTTTFMNGYPGQTTWALGERCNLQMDEDCNFFIDRYNSVVQIVDLGQMKSLNDIPLQLPLNGWSDRVPIQPLHGYIIYAEDLPEDNKPAKAVFIRLFVLDFNLNDDKTTTGHMQFQIVQEGYTGKYLGLHIPLTPSEDISSFFNTTLLPYGESILSNFFPSPSHLTHQKDTCYLVNSQAAFEELYTGDEELPEINFNEQSLLIGMVMKPAGYSLEYQYIYVTDDSIVVTLSMKKLKGAFIAAIVPYYFWGLYEKLPQKNVEIKKYPYELNETTKAI